jgi:adenylate cyclase
MLVKKRYHLSFGGRFWSLDLFEGPLAGLAILEVEAEDLAALAALVPPQWAAKEITRDPRCQCGALAWTQAIPEVEWRVS